MSRLLQASSHLEPDKLVASQGVQHHGGNSFVGGWDVKLGVVVGTGELLQTTKK